MSLGLSAGMIAKNPFLAHQSRAGCLIFMRTECYFIPAVMLVSLPSEEWAASRTHTSRAAARRGCRLLSLWLGLYIFWGARGTLTPDWEGLMADAHRTGWQRTASPAQDPGVPSKPSEVWSDEALALLIWRALFPHLSPPTANAPPSPPVPGPSHDTE